MNNRSFLTGNQLKILALISMTIDHIGVQLLPQLQILRIIGRLAFPIFAFMIAEGCRYTKNRRKYLLLMAGMALILQIVYFIAMKSLYQCVFVTFSLGICLIYTFDYMCNKRDFFSSALFAVCFAAVYFICSCLPDIFNNTDFEIDYGFFGVLLPLYVYAAKTNTQELIFMAVGLVLLAINNGGNQWFSLITLIPLALYNGKRGKMNMKYLFYIYYPVHLVIIYIISFLVETAY